MVTTTNAGKDSENLDHSYTVDRNVNWYCHSKSLAVSKN